ncbi:MAG: protein kinase [Gemmatimonadetes bacterium]|nr:protein kinase [Gemmatimonadota bacterium]
MTDLLHTHVKQLLAKDYDVGEELGRGGMAVVYRAHFRAIGRAVAIKVLPPHLAVKPGARERFVREARLSAGLDHPGIVRVYAAALAGDVAWFGMTLIEGESLGRRIAREKQLSISDTRSLLTAVADALSYAHAGGIVHRDIKPDNILIDGATGCPVVTDFGIARTLDDDVQLTADGVTVGTPAYMSPEQARGSVDVDERSDIYSLGVVGYQLLTGRLPFTASNPLALLMMQTAEQPKPVLELRPDVPPSLASAIDRALERRPDDRWPSAASFRDHLRDPGVPEMIIAPYVARSADRPSQGDPLAAPKRRRITLFRRKALRYLGITGALAVANLLYDPSFLLFEFFAGLMLLNLIRLGSRLYAEDIPVRELFLNSAPPDRQPALPVNHYTARYEAAQRTAAREHAEIGRMLAMMSEGERAIVGDVAPTVDALSQRIQSWVNGLREIDTQLDVEADITGSVLLQLDSAVDAMRGVRMQLMHARDNKFQGVDDLMLTTQRARALSRTG